MYPLHLGWVRQWFIGGSAKILHAETGDWTHDLLRVSQTHYSPSHDTRNIVFLLVVWATGEFNQICALSNWWRYDASDISWRHQYKLGLNAPVVWTWCHIPFSDCDWLSWPSMVSYSDCDIMLGTTQFTWLPTRVLAWLNKYCPELPSCSDFYLVWVLPVIIVVIILCFLKCNFECTRDCDVTSIHT